MTRAEAQMARAAARYVDLPHRIRVAKATFRSMAAGAIGLLLLGLGFAGSDSRWALAAPVWLGTAALVLVVAMIARVRQTTLERRQAEKDAEQRLADLAAQGRRMRIAAAFAGDLVGHLAVADAVEERAAA